MEEYEKSNLACKGLGGMTTKPGRKCRKIWEFSTLKHSMICAENGKQQQIRSAKSKKRWSVKKIEDIC